MWKLIKKLFKAIGRLLKNVLLLNGEFKQDLKDVVIKSQELWKEIKDLVKYTK